MAKDSITFNKSKVFAVRVVKLYKYLTLEKQEYVLSKQLLRGGTSIGANMAEALCGISDKDFLAKAYISLKECAETQYWLELLYETEFLSNQEYESILFDCIELRKQLTSLTKTLSQKISTQH